MTSFSKRMSEISGEAIKEILKHAGNPDLISFGAGSPAKEFLPIADIKNLINRILDEDGTKVLSYGVSEGWLPLRQAYLDHIAAPKGVKADVENIIITTGGSQALQLLVEIFINPGDVVFVESPTYLASLGVFDKYYAKSIAIETDEQGILIDDLEKKIKKYHPKILYTIPTFQNPTGNTLPLERRKRIAELASKYDFIVM